MTESKENFLEDTADEAQSEDLMAKMRKELDAARSLLEGPRMGLPNELIAKTKRFIEEADKKLEESQGSLVAKQIEEAYQELIMQEPELKEKIDTIQKATELPPKEFELKDLDQLQQQKIAEQKDILQSARSEQPASKEFFLKVYVYPREFKSSPEKFNLYMQWLEDAQKNFSNQSVTFESLETSLQNEFLETGKVRIMIENQLKRHGAPDDVLILEMATAVNTIIRLLGNTGVPDSQLTLDAFNTWLNSKHKRQ